MTTLLLDGDIYLHRACVHASTKAEFDGVLHWKVDPRVGNGWIRREIKRLKKHLSASKVIIALGDRQANFRKDLDPTYKAARRLMPKPPGFLELEENMRAHAEVRSEPRLEGDDILGLLATKEPVADKIVVSIDKDLLQIPGKHYNPDKDAMEVVDERVAKHRHYLQTLTGDRVDGYPGCPGVGPVKAAKILTAKTIPPEHDAWFDIVAAFEKAGQTEEQALLQARLARILRQGDYDRKTKTIRLWTPPYRYAQ